VQSQLFKRKRSGGCSSRPAWAKKKKEKRKEKKKG
jgi:hypothetical protein